MEDGAVMEEWELIERLAAIFDLLDPAWRKDLQLYRKNRRQVTDALDFLRYHLPDRDNNRHLTQNEKRDPSRYHRKVTPMREIMPADDDRPPEDDDP